MKKILISLIISFLWVWIIVPEISFAQEIDITESISSQDLWEDKEVWEDIILDCETDLFEDFFPPSDTTTKAFIATLDYVPIVNICEVDNEKDFREAVADKACDEVVMSKNISPTPPHPSNTQVIAKNQIVDNKEQPIVTLLDVADEVSTPYHQDVFNEKHIKKKTLWNIYFKVFFSLFSKLICYMHDQNISV